MGNNALQTNSDVGRQADLAITSHGSDWYYTVCAIMGVSALAVMALALMKPIHTRLFHYISALILWTACIAYFAMGSNLGQTPVPVEFVRQNSQVGGAGFPGATREIFYARYIDWFITTPLLLMDLMLTAGIPWPVILTTIVADEFMVVTGLIGALTRTRYKWGFWTFGTAAFLFVVYNVAFVGMKYASALGGGIKRTYLSCGVLTLGIWLLYPIAWGVSEGGNVIHPDSEAIFYGILDLIAKPGFTALLLFGHRSVDPTALGLHFREPKSTTYATKESHGGDHAHLGEHNGHGTHNGHNGATVSQPTATGAVA